MNKYTAILALSTLVSFNSKAMEQPPKSLAEETMVGTTETEGSESSPAPFSREATPYYPPACKIVYVLTHYPPACKMVYVLTHATLEKANKAIQTEPIFTTEQLRAIQQQQKK